MSDEAWAAWDGYAGWHGTTISALVEALGAQLGRDTKSLSLANAVTLARRITHERRRRGKP